METVLAKEDTLYRLGVLEACPCHNVVLAGVNFPLYEATAKKTSDSRPRSIRAKTARLSDEKVEAIRKSMSETAVRWINKEKTRGQVIKYLTQEDIEVMEERRKKGDKRYGRNKSKPQHGDETIEKYLIFEKAESQKMEDNVATIAAQDQQIADLKAKLKKIEDDAQAEEDNPRDRGPGGQKKPKSKKGKNHPDSVHGDGEQSGMSIGDSK